MKVKLIVILLILLIEISCQIHEYYISIIDNTPIISVESDNVIISTNLTESIYNISLYKNNCDQYYHEDEIIVRYFYLVYEDKIGCINSTINQTEPTFPNLEKDEISQSFKLVNFIRSTIQYKNISYILSLNTNAFPLMILNYINNVLIFGDDNITNENILSKENLCYNNSLKDTENNKLFICKLDYILFGHEDLKKDDVYLAKEIKEEHSIAILDNLLTFNIFPDDYLDYFFTSFFSELNDKCEKKEYKLEGYKNTIYYIVCPKKKIELYTKRRKLSVIINKFSYKILDLFQDSLEFLNKIEDDKYYFNIVFEKERKNFTLGIGFFKNKKFGIYNNCTYIFSKDRDNYTEDLTDINSDQFEIWLYILTTISFTFLLLIFTIIGCIHSKKVNKELNEMLK